MKTKVIAVPTQEISKIVQEKLFKLGYTWCYNTTNIVDCYARYGKEAYIALFCHFTLQHGHRRSFLGECDQDQYQEITVYDLFQMKPLKTETIILTTDEGVTIEISRELLEILKKLN